MILAGDVSLTKKKKKRGPEPIITEFLSALRSVGEKSGISMCKFCLSASALFILAPLQGLIV